MIIGGVAELALGVEAAQRSLEDIAAPLSASPVRASGAGADHDHDRVPSPPAPPRTYNTDPVDDDPERDRELGALLEALRNGPLERSELQARAGAHDWAPGRFAAALRHGLATGVLLPDGPAGSDGSDRSDGRVRARYHD
jgi:hypothetical protein